MFNRSSVTSAFFSTLTILWMFAGVQSISHAYAEADPEDPTSLISGVADEFIGKLQSQREEIDADPLKLYRLVEDVVLPHMDLQKVSAWVLGKNWRRATKKQRAEFEAQFRTLLVRTYATAMKEYATMDVSYSDPLLKKNRATVRSKILNGGMMIQVNYSLYQRKDGTWKVYDVSVDGISLVTTYRRTFSDQVRHYGIDSLIAKLAEQNQSVLDSIKAEYSESNETIAEESAEHENKHANQTEASGSNHTVSVKTKPTTEVSATASDR